MNINFMRYFVTVTETGSFTAASKHLGIAQPAISMALTKLESELGTELINRSKRKFELTYAGEVFLDHCKNILNTTDNAINQVREINNLEQGSIKIAAPTLFASVWMADLISEFQHKHPKLVLELKTGNSAQLTKLIENNQQDFVIVHERDLNSKLESTLLYEDEIYVQMSEDHPLANSQHIPIKLLMQHPMCRPLDSVIVDRFLEQIYNSKNLRPNIALSTNLQSLIYASIVNNKHICIGGSKMRASMSNIVSLPIEGGPYKFKLYAAWQKNRYTSKASEKFLDFLRSKVEDHSQKRSSL